MVIREFSALSHQPSAISDGGIRTARDLKRISKAEQKRLLTRETALAFVLRPSWQTHVIDPERIARVGERYGADEGGTITSLLNELFAVMV
jgi:hypothetical protein